MKTHLFIMLVGLFCLMSPLWGQVDPSRPLTLHGIALYPHAFQADCYYYLPGKLRLATKSDEHPDFMFMQSRYVGTRLHGDQGDAHFRHILRFRIRLEPASQDSLAKIKARMPRIKIFSLPIKHLEASLNYSLEAEGTQNYKLSEGSLEEDGSGLFWTEKEYRLRLDNTNAGILAEAIESGSVLMSFQYQFWVQGIRPKQIEISEDSSLVSPLIEEFTPDTNLTKFPIYSEVVNILVDNEQFPGLYQYIELGAIVQSAYAHIDVYDYSHQTPWLDSLHAKRLEILAVADDGSPLQLRHTFRYNEERKSYITLGFPFAVRTDESYRYRITSILKSGEILKSEWIHAPNWTAVIDITRGPETKKEKRKESIESMEKLNEE